MQEENWDQNLLWPEAWEQRQQINACRDVEDQGGGNEVEGEDAIKNSGHNLNWRKRAHAPNETQGQRPLAACALCFHFILHN